MNKITCQGCKFLMPANKKDPLDRCTALGTVTVGRQSPITGQREQRYPVCFTKNHGLDCPDFEEVVLTFWQFITRWPRWRK